MNRNIFISFGFHILLVLITAMSLPFLAKKPIDLPPIVSVELIQITDKTNIPFAPKAKKIIEKVKEKEKKLVSEQACSETSFFSFSLTFSIIFFALGANGIFVLSVI